MNCILEQVIYTGLCIFYAFHIVHSLNVDAEFSVHRAQLSFFLLKNKKEFYFFICVLCVDGLEIKRDLAVGSCKQ